MSARRLVRRVAAPRDGLGYELFDDAVFVGLFSLLIYVVTSPSEATVFALSDSLSVILAPHTWGLILCMAALVAAGLSFGELRAVKAGYIVQATTCAGWSVSLAAGTIAAMPPWDVAGKGLAVSLLYAWVTRGMLHEVLKASGRPPEEPSTTEHA